MKTVYAQCRAAAKKLNLPSSNLRDLTFHDRNSFERKPGSEFLWVLYNHGTHLIDLSLKYKRGDLTFECIERNCSEPDVPTRYYYIKNGVVRSLSHDDARELLEARPLGATYITDRGEQ